MPKAVRSTGPVMLKKVVFNLINTLFFAKQAIFQKLVLYNNSIECRIELGLFNLIFSIANLQSHMVNKSRLLLMLIIV